MVKIDPIIALAFAIHHNRGAYAVLVGSGISSGAGIPTGWQVVEDLIRKMARLEGADVGDDPAGFYREHFGEEPEYSKLLNELAKTPIERNLLLRKYFEPTDEQRQRGVKIPSDAHRALADLAERGYIGLFLTTNFDRLLEQALEDVGIVPMVHSTADSIQGAVPLVHAGCTVLKLNGDYLDPRMKNTPAELDSYDKSIDALLDRVIAEYGFIVCGWSAEWDTALCRAIKRCQSHRYTMYWTGTAPPGEQAAELIQLRHAEFVHIEDANTFFTDLARKVTKLERRKRPYPPGYSTPEGVIQAPPTTSQLEPEGITKRLIRSFAGNRLLVALAVVAVAVAIWYSRTFPLESIDVLSKSIAVLPFENMSNVEEDYFVDGMHEALTTELTKIGDLRVKSVRRSPDVDIRVPQIAQKLGVNYVIEGSVLPMDSLVLITVRLILGSTAENVWADNYERDLRDVLTLQREVAREIAHEVKATITPEEEEYLASARPVNPEAYVAYLKGRDSWNKRTEEGLVRGIEYFQEAVVKDPDYALAYTGLADSYNILARYSYLSPVEAMPKANAAAIRALEMDATLAEAHNSLAFVKRYYDWDWQAAEQEYQRALELYPHYATARHWYALFLAGMGRIDQAISEIKQAKELEPLSRIINSDVASIYYFDKQNDKAIDQFLEILKLEPGFGVAHLGLGRTYVQEEMFEEAIAEFQKAVTLSPSSTAMLAALGYGYAVSGNKGEAVKVLDKLEELSTSKYVSAYEIATINVGLGNKYQAFQWLDKAYAERSSYLGNVKVDPRLESLRSDPRFQDLLRRMNLLE